jgi:hypothetical protein
MSQHDFNIANQSFPATRTDLNNALQALASNSSGDAEPSTTFANQWWYETDTNTLKLRNEANNAWLSFATVDQTTGDWTLAHDVDITGTLLVTGVLTANGGAVFNESGADVDFRVESDTDANALFVEGSSSYVGIGTSSPSFPLDVNHASDNGLARFTSGDADAYITISDVNSSSAYNKIGVITHDMYFNTNNSESMRIDSSGNVGIGTSSPTGLLNVKSTYVSDATTQTRLEDTTGCSLDFGGNGSGHKWINSRDTAAGTAVPMIFQTGGTERMRIDSSGNLIVNNAAATGKVNSSNAGGVAYSAEINATGAGMKISSLGLSNTMNAITFHTNYGDIGSITCGSSTAYNTSSDYRLKTDAQPMTGASARVLALKPVNFEWISSGERVDGFLAHEAQEVVPECVTGTKDAVGADGKPEYQGIDQSKLVPLLTAALQEALTEISALKARVTALEG